MQRLLAITWLTWKAALRFRLFWVIAALLVGSVVVLPVVIKDDGTARGFVQILLTYTLSTVIALLGLCTLWLSCGTLARDIEENQMQVVAVKPVARWQIWLGKWMGILSLDAALLAVAGIAIFGLMHWRAQKLSPTEQRVLREEVLVARASLREPRPDVEAEAERIFRERTRDMTVDPANAAAVKAQIREALKVEVVRPNYMRRYQLDLGLRRNRLQEVPLFARLKFHAASTNALGTYALRIEVGEPSSPQRFFLDRTFADNAFHEVRIPPNLWNQAGVLTIDVMNRSGVALAFPLEDGFELLYRESTFGLNFARALIIIACWLALLGAIGLAAASFLSFPVATFVSASLMVVALSSGTLAAAVESGSISAENEETGQVESSPLDVVLIPLFKVLLTVFSLAQDFTPVDALSTGRSIEWGIVARAFGQVVLLLGGFVAAFGIWMFHRRELAASNTQS
jgi:hypothetical protein